MLSNFLQNMTDLVLSIPTNLVILLIICLLLKFFLNWSLKDCIKVIVGYALIMVILSFFGITMPSFITIFNYIKAWIIKIVNKIW